MRRHPGDSRLYLQYLQLLGVESQVALPRGLLKFPDVPEMYVLAASAARKSGNRAVAIRATREAIKRDSTLTLQYLQLADRYFEDGRPDSAVRALARAPRAYVAAASPQLARNQLVQAFDAMRAAVDQTTKVLCKDTS